MIKKAFFFSLLTIIMVISLISEGVCGLTGIHVPEKERFAYYSKKSQKYLEEGNEQKHRSNLEKARHALVSFLYKVKCREAWSTYRKGNKQKAIKDLEFLSETLSETQSLRLLGYIYYQESENILKGTPSEEDKKLAKGYKTQARAAHQRALKRYDRCFFQDSQTDRGKTQPTSLGFFQILPNEMIFLIEGYLSREELISWEGTSKAFQNHFLNKHITLPKILNWARQLPYLHTEPAREPTLKALTLFYEDASLETSLKDDLIFLREFFSKGYLKQDNIWIEKKNYEKLRHFHEEFCRKYPRAIRDGSCNIPFSSDGSNSTEIFFLNSHFAQILKHAESFLNQVVLLDEEELKWIESILPGKTESLSYKEPSKESEDQLYSNLLTICKYMIFWKTEECKKLNTRRSTENFESLQHLPKKTIPFPSPQEGYKEIPERFTFNVPSSNFNFMSKKFKEFNIRELLGADQRFLHTPAKGIPFLSPRELYEKIPEKFEPNIKAQIFSDITDNLLSLKNVGNGSSLLKKHNQVVFLLLKKFSGFSSLARQAISNIEYFLKENYTVYLCEVLNAALPKNLLTQDEATAFLKEIKILREFYVTMPYSTSNIFKSRRLPEEQVKQALSLLAFYRKKGL